MSLGISVWISIFRLNVSSEALIEHKHNLRKALGRLFEEFAYDHTVVLYGDPSPQLLEGARTMMPDVKIKVYPLLQGLE